MRGRFRFSVIEAVKILLKVLAAILLLWEPTLRAAKFRQKSVRQREKRRLAEWQGHHLERLIVSRIEESYGSDEHNSHDLLMEAFETAHRLPTLYSRFDQVLFLLTNALIDHDLLEEAEQLIMWVNDEDMRWTLRRDIDRRLRA